MHLQVDKDTGRVRNWGDPRWGNADQYPDAVVIDIGEQPKDFPDDDPRDYLYNVKTGAFVLDPLPPTADELDRTSARDVPTILTTIDAYQTRIQQGKTALASATTAVQMKPIMAGLLDLQQDELALLRLLVKVVGKLV